jgi:hypothetical protein
MAKKERPLRGNRGAAQRPMGKHQMGNKVRSRDSAPAAPAQADARPLVDAEGRRYREHILTSWHPAAIRALGIRRADGGAL